METARYSASERRIHVAAGTLGTTAGLALGLALAGERVEIAATRITSRLVTNERALAALVHGASSILQRAGIDVPAPATISSSVTFVHDQIGAGYGRSTDAAQDAIARFTDAGLVLDTTYTAKAAAALIADPLTAAGGTLFLHTLSALEPTAAAAHITRANMPHQIATYITDDI